MIQRIGRRKPGISAVALLTARGARAAAPSEIVIDRATDNPLRFALTDQRLPANAFASDKIAVRRGQSAGSNKASEFLDAGSLEFGSVAGAAALIGKVNGNPIRTIHVYPRPEWTALVTMPDSPIKTVAGLTGQRIAPVSGSGQHIEAGKALQAAGALDASLDVTAVMIDARYGSALGA